MLTAIERYGAIFNRPKVGENVYTLCEPYPHLRHHLIIDSVGWLMPGAIVALDEQESRTNRIQVKRTDGAVVWFEPWHVFHEVNLAHKAALRGMP